MVKLGNRQWLLALGMQTDSSAREREEGGKTCLHHISLAWAVRESFNYSIIDYFRVSHSKGKS